MVSIIYHSGWNSGKPPGNVRYRLWWGQNEGCRLSLVLFLLFNEVFHGTLRWQFPELNVWCKPNGGTLPLIL